VAGIAEKIGIFEPRIIRPTPTATQMAGQMLGGSDAPMPILVMASSVSTPHTMPHKLARTLDVKPPILPPQ
jgi:hypothetical protein